MINEFDLNVRKSINWSQVEDNASGKLNNTLAIFWYGFIFLKKGLCLTPKISMTKNIGHDGSGIHSYLDNECASANINNREVTNFPNLIEENIYCLNQIRKYLNKKNRILIRLRNKAFFVFQYFKNKL